VFQRGSSGLYKLQLWLHPYQLLARRCSSWHR
jgi:hypothetical protein